MTTHLARAFAYVPQNPVAKLILIKASDGPGQLKTTIAKLVEWTGAYEDYVWEGINELVHEGRIKFTCYTYDEEVEIEVLP